MFPLTGRMKEVLRMVIEDYIHTAEPVSSMSISRKSAIRLSPATIRSVMSDLEETGLLSQPHTSAGRVPTERGFRFYVDSILDLHELSGEEKREIRSRYSISQSEWKDLFREACRVLSSFSHCLGVVWAPRLSELILQHIEFVKLKKHLTLAIFVSTTGIVQNRIIQMDEDLSQSDLDHLSDDLNELLTGLTLQQVREKLFSRMRMEKHSYDRLFRQAIHLGGKAFSSFDETDVFIEGRTNILSEPEFGNISIMADLLRAFEEKATMVKLLDQCMAPRGVRISIGSESQVQEMETCSLVTSTYGCEGRVWGALGVIGPRRMNYSRIIPLVDYSAKLLSEMLDTYYH
ncbi:MAG: heat-inducible transcription repressor HrcA [Deltaproteobacteria bacterium]|nr:heat-inducible transcription repressor HrcA [Deltaproteobacteria bacterium]